MARNKITINNVTEELNDARLPASLGTAGLVLAVNNEATGITWQTIDVSSEISAHNTSSSAHSDIRSSKEDKGYVTIGGTTYLMELTSTDPGVGTAGKIIIVTG